MTTEFTHPVEYRPRVSVTAVSSTENGIDLPDDASLYSVISGAAAADPQRLSLCGADGTQLTAAEVDRRARALASALAARGVAAGDRVAILGRTDLAWALLDCALLALGAVVVPVYPTSSPAQIAHILTDSGSAYFAAEDETDAARLRAAGAAVVWTFAQLADWADGEVDAALADRIAAVRPDDLAMIVYTSGTTGVSKGCLITHRNMFVSSANTVRQTGDMFDGTTVLALPLSHVFGQTILFACLFGGSRTHLLPGIPDLVPALPRLRPTFLALIPFGLEKIRKYCRTLVSEAEEATAVERGLELLGTRGYLEQGEPSPDADRMAEQAGAQGVSEATGHPVAAALGGRLRYVISGGASLDDSTSGFYAGFGVVLLNCYGLTEAATAVTVSAPATNRLGTVGRPIPGTSVAIAAADGEVLVGGPHVSPGYWGAAADQAVVDAEGWLHTGDLGELDVDGFLRITGRKKEILVTSGGKNVAPAPLEDRVRLQQVVSNCMVVGEGRDYVTALITLDPAQVRRWRENEPDGDLTAVVQSAVDDANSLVSRAESIRAFRIVEGDFTVEDGLLTASRKLRRAAIAEAFAADIAELYARR